MLCTVVVLMPICSSQQSSTTTPRYSSSTVGSTTTTVPSRPRPSDTTAVSGSDVVFTCSGGWVVWKVYKSSGSSYIYDVQSNTLPDNTKYQVNKVGNQQNLRILNINPAEDGGTYECRSEDLPSEPYLANLVIIGKLIYRPTRNLTVFLFFLFSPISTADFELNSCSELPL